MFFILFPSFEEANSPSFAGVSKMFTDKDNEDRHWDNQRLLGNHICSVSMYLNDCKNFPKNPNTAKSVIESRNKGFGFVPSFLFRNV